MLPGHRLSVKLQKTCANLVVIHDDVMKWSHFPRYWPFVRGIHRSPVNSPHKGQWRGALIFSLIFVWINGWVNNREAGDLRRYRAHYHVTVIGRLWHICRTGGGGNWYTYIRIDIHIHIESGAVITWLIFPQILKNTPHSASIVARYGVSFVYPASDWYSASVPIIICVKYYNFGVPYNGTRPYIHIYIYIRYCCLTTSFCLREGIFSNTFYYH